MRNRIIMRTAGWGSLCSLTLFCPVPRAHKKEANLAIGSIKYTQILPVYYWKAKANARAFWILWMDTMEMDLTYAQFLN